MNRTGFLARVAGAFAAVIAAPQALLGRGTRVLVKYVGYTIAGRTAIFEVVEGETYAETARSATSAVRNRFGAYGHEIANMEGSNDRLAASLRAFYERQNIDHRYQLGADSGFAFVDRLAQALQA